VPFIPPHRFLALLSEERAKREYEAKLYPELARRPQIFHDRKVDLALQYQEDMAAAHDQAASDPAYYTLTPNKQVIRVPHYPISDADILYNRTPSPEPLPLYNVRDFKPTFSIDEDRMYN